ncbi:MAG TPA: GNAT family N-acetyltransferase [Acidimicrobiales bacterium]
MITYRRVRPGEGPAVASVFGAARAEMTYLPSLHTPAEDVEFFSEIVAAGAGGSVAVGGSGCWVMVAEGAGGDLVGFCVVRAGWVEQLYVRPGYQSQGIGGTLLSAAIAEHGGGEHCGDEHGGDEHGGGELLLWVFEENTGAERFYRRAGFYEVERTDGSDNEERAPDIRMRREPDPPPAP